jgi:hypothetical protein
MGSDGPLQNFVPQHLARLNRGRRTSNVRTTRSPSGGWSTPPGSKASGSRSVSNGLSSNGLSELGSSSEPYSLSQSEVFMEDLNAEGRGTVIDQHRMQRMLMNGADNISSQDIDDRAECERLIEE